MVRHIHTYLNYFQNILSRHHRREFTPHFCHLNGLFSLAYIPFYFVCMVVLSPTPPLQDWASQEGKVFLGGPRRVSFVGPQKWELKIKLVFKELTLYLAVTQYTLN